MMASSNSRFTMSLVLVYLFTVSALPGKRNKNMSLACNVDYI